MKAPITASTRRRGASVLELITSIAILGLVLTIIAQCTLSGGRAFRETRRRDHALELCNRALERVAANNDVSNLTAIADQLSDPDYQVTLLLSSDSQITATTEWQNDLGATHTLQLHAWLSPVKPADEESP